MGTRHIDWYLSPVITALPSREAATERAVEIAYGYLGLRARTTLAETTQLGDELIGTAEQCQGRGRRKRPASR